MTFIGITTGRWLTLLSLRNLTLTHLYPAWFSWSADNDNWSPRNGRV